MFDVRQENAAHYECLKCGELVPDGCCTCGPRRMLQLLGVTCKFTRNPYIRERWKHVVSKEKLHPKSLISQQAILAAAQYIAMLESALKGKETYV